jgi:hypothetical protein
MKDATCLWCTPSGYCGPARSESGDTLLLCNRLDGCGFEARTNHLFYTLGDTQKEQSPRAEQNTTERQCSCEN